MKRKKLYYIPGLMSIIGLPFLLFFWGPEDPVEYCGPTLNLTSNAKDTPGVERFTNGVVYNAIKNKKLISVDISGVDRDDGSPEYDQEVYVQNEKLAYIKHEVERFQFTHDTTVVLKVQFGHFCSYKDFIWVLDQARIFHIQRFALIDDVLYLIPNPAPVVTKNEAVIEPFSHANPFDWPVAQKRAEPTQWELFKTEISYKWENLKLRFEYLFYDQKQNRLLAYGFLLLILIPSILKIRQYSRAGILS